MKHSVHKKRLNVDGITSKNLHKAANKLLVFFLYVSNLVKRVEIIK